MMTTTISMITERAIHSLLPLWRFLWKEFRERRWWAISWMLFMLAASLLAHGQHFCGDIGWTSPPWNYLSPIFAGVVGLTCYSSELQRGRALFLFSRPVHWEQILLAKVLFGGIIMLGTPLLAACIFYCSCAEQYRHFVTLSNVLSGIGLLVWPLALCYLCGLASSIILPGLVGGILTVTCIVIAILLYWISGLWLCGLQHSSLFRSDVLLPLGILLSAMLGIIWGAVSAARRGLYHDYFRRIILFAPKFMLTMLLGTIICLSMPQSLLEHLFLHWDYPAEYSITISPHGIYAYVPLTQYFSIFGIHPTYPGETSWRGKVVRLADNAVLPVIFTKEMKNSPEPGKWRWVTDNIATVRIPLTNDKMIYHMDNGKQIRTSAQFVGIPSPNGRFAVCIQVNSDKPNDKVVYLKLCNLDNGHTLQIALPINHPDQWKWCYWWVSNDTVGYYTHQGGYNRIHSDPHSWLPVSHEEVHYLHLPIF